MILKIIEGELRTMIMNEKELFEAFSDIDDELIERSEKKTKARKINFKMKLRLAIASIPTIPISAKESGHIFSAFSITAFIIFSFL